MSGVVQRLWDTCKKFFCARLVKFATSTISGAASAFQEPHCFACCRTSGAALWYTNRPVRLVDRFEVLADSRRSGLPLSSPVVAQWRFSQHEPSQALPLALAQLVQLERGAANRDDISECVLLIGLFLVAGVVRFAHFQRTTDITLVVGGAARFSEVKVKGRRDRMQWSAPTVLLTKDFMAEVVKFWHLTQSRWLGATCVCVSLDHHGVFGGTHTFYF